MAAVIAGIRKSTRGFKYSEEIAGTHGGSIEAYESSAADGPHVWVKVSDPDPLPWDDDQTPCAHVHLTLEAAEGLRDVLDYLIKNHYQQED